MPISRLLVAALLFCSVGAWADGVVSADGTQEASKQERASQYGPQYPGRVEIWVRERGGKHVLHVFPAPPKGRRMEVLLRGWNGSDIVLTYREWPLRRMSDDYASSMRSCLYFLSAKTGAMRAWSQGSVNGYILDVRHGLACVGLDGDTGGGAGMPPWLGWKTLLITDLNGHDRQRWHWKEVGAYDSGVRYADHALSPDGLYVATYDDSIIEGSHLVVRSVDGRIERRVESPGVFHWTDHSGQVKVDGGLYDVVSGTLSPPSPAAK